MEFENAGRSLTFNRFGGPFLTIRGRRGEGGGELIRSVRREGGWMEYWESNGLHEEGGGGAKNILVPQGEIR